MSVTLASSLLRLGLQAGTGSTWTWIPTRTSHSLLDGLQLGQTHGRFPLMALVFPMDLSLPHGLVPLVRTWTSQPQGLGPPLGLGLLFGTQVFHRNYACQHYRFGSTNIQMILNA